MRQTGSRAAIPHSILKFPWDLGFEIWDFQK
jgi:hypothetical protein